MSSPTDSNAFSSHAEIEKVKKEIEQLEYELQEAVQIFEKAKSHMLRLKKKLEERKASIAPIRAIPVEILIEIFLLASKDDDLAPVILSGVCRWWRNTILATPRAWSFIRIGAHMDQK